jgi:hypothetical protein
MPTRKATFCDFYFIRYKMVARKERIWVNAQKNAVTICT